MQEYHKIQSVYKRDPVTKMSTFLSEYSTPEIEYLAENDWTWTEKINGTNIRVGYEGTGLYGKYPEVLFGGKTDKAQIPAHLLTRLQELFSVEAMVEVFPTTVEMETIVTLHGEGYGVKIQKGGGYIPDGVDFILFDVRIGPWWLKREDVAQVAEDLGIKHVPVMNTGPLWAAQSLVEDGFPTAFGTCQAEGLVLRPAVELAGRNGRRIITKLKTKDFNPN